MEFGESYDEVIVVGRPAPSLPQGEAELLGMGYSLCVIYHSYVSLIEIRYAWVGT
jgi:hypothetical protein